MIISSKLKTKIYKDYDFMFSQGIMIPISIEPEAGDSIEFFEDTIKVYLAKRVSPTDSTVIMPAEEKTFFKTHLIAIEHRTRPQRPQVWNHPITLVPSSTVTPKGSSLREGQTKTPKGFCLP